jgi:hypothetical protein
MRRLLRFVVPRSMRLSVAVLRRGIRDAVSGTRFAAKRKLAPTPHVVERGSGVHLPFLGTRGGAIDAAMRSLRFAPLVAPQRFSVEGVRPDLVARELGRAFRWGALLAERAAGTSPAEERAVHAGTHGRIIDWPMASRTRSAI